MQNSYGHSNGRLNYLRCFLPSEKHPLCKKKSQEPQMRLNSQLNRLGVHFRGTGSVTLAHSVVEVGLEAQLVVLVPWGTSGMLPRAGAGVAATFLFSFPACLQHQSCETCVSSELTFNCSWCHVLQRYRPHVSLPPLLPWVFL